MDTFKNAYDHLSDKLNLKPDQDIWASFGPYSSQLDVDEAEDINKTWDQIGSLIGKEVDEVKQAVAPVKDLYIILDHTRTVLMTVIDGSLPSNNGGGANVRNILRRVFAILEKNGWWDLIGGLDGLLEFIQIHKLDLEGIHGEFREYKSFDQIIRMEHTRWSTTDVEQKKQLQKLLKKQNGNLSIDDWIIALQTWGIPAETIAEISKKQIPNNLYYEIAERLERITKAPEVILYDTTHLTETKNLYYQDHKLYDFESTVQDVFLNIKQNNRPNIVILNESAFYPTSGGQVHDMGTLTLDGITYNVVNCEKVGKSVLHILDQDLTQDKETLIGKPVVCRVDEARRSQLRAHHTGTHVVFASCRQVLGPHIWQNGSKNDLGGAHLDITHYAGITKEEELEIENTANRIIQKAYNIKKTFMDKSEAEREYGFSLYQGGIVPGNTLRVVDIEGIDTEACCGTHCDSTAEVGWLKMVRTTRISDGVVRLYYCASEKAMSELNKENNLLNSMCQLWGVEQSKLYQTGDRFFNEYKRQGNVIAKQKDQILNLQMKCVVTADTPQGFYQSEEDNAKIYISFLPSFAQDLKARGKGVVFIGENFVVGILGNPGEFNFEEFKEVVSAGSQVKAMSKKDVNFVQKVKKKKVTTKTSDMLYFQIIGEGISKDLSMEYLSSHGFHNFE